MGLHEVVLSQLPAPVARRSGIIAHRSLLGVGGEDACIAMSSGRGLSEASFTCVDDPPDAWAFHAARARVLAIPRRDEAPLPPEAWDLLLVALAVGLPVVSTRRGGLAALLTHGAEGYLASLEHDLPLDLSPAAAKILDDDTLFERFSRGARARVVVTNRDGRIAIAPAPAPSSR